MGAIVFVYNCDAPITTQTGGSSPYPAATIWVRENLGIQTLRKGPCRLSMYTGWLCIEFHPSSPIWCGGGVTWLASYHRRPYTSTRRSVSTGGLPHGYEHGLRAHTGCPDIRSYKRRRSFARYLSQHSSRSPLWFPVFQNPVPSLAACSCAIALHQSIL